MTTLSPAIDWSKQQRLRQEAEQNQVRAVPGKTAPNPVPVAPDPGEFPTSVPKTTQPATAAATPVSKEAFNKELEAAIDENPLNQYWQPTYHFTLFMAGDVNVLENVSSVADIGKASSNLRQVIIAESGVTGSYNIKSVDIDTVNAQNASTREQKATVLTMMVTEPLGVSFLDALYGAASFLNVFDYTKMVYFLKLNFLGYDANGKFAGNPLPLGPRFANGGQWVWALKLTNVEVKINEGGGNYTLHFVTTEAEPLIIEEKILSTMDNTLTVKGKTLREMLNSFAEALNDQWKKKFLDKKTGGSLMEFSIVTHPIPWLPGNVDPGDFQMKPQQEDKSYIRALSLEDKQGVATAQVPQGVTVNEFITSAIKSTDRGQELIKDEPIPQEFDASTTVTNSKKFRASTLFAIEPVIDSVKKVDPETGNYIKHVTLHVVPTYTQNVVLTRTQTEDAEDPNAQRRMIQDLIKNGFVRKRYNYIFTGLNTEVIDFRIEFNLAWQSALPRLAGARMNATNEAVHAQYNPDQRVAPHPDDPTKSKECTVSATSPFKQANDSRSKVYLESILSQLNQGQSNQQIAGPNGPLPISFWPHDMDVERETGLGINPAFHRGLSTVGAVMLQAFDKTLTGGFQNIELNIKGDPYWLGQTNLHRELVLKQSGSATLNPADIPDYSSGNPAIIIHFRYPLQIGDDFKPVLKDSEVFNGMYEVTRVKHSFTEGSFKQTVYAVRMALINLQLASTADTNTINHDRGSRDVADGNPSGDAGNSSGGNTPGNGSSHIAPTGGPPNDATQRQRAQESYDFWTGKGYSPAAASGMVAQEEAETKFDWTQTGDSGQAKGAFQWHPDRQQAILNGTGINVADPNTTHQQQLEAAHWEQTQGGEKSAGAAIRSATTGGDAGSIATFKYERPGDIQRQAQIRGGRGQFWQNHFTNSSSTAS